MILLDNTRHIIKLTFGLLLLFGVGSFTNVTAQTAEEFQCKAEDLYDSGNYHEALDAADKALSLCLAEFGSNTIECFKPLQLFANIHRQLNELQVADSLYKVSHQLLVNNQGEEHPEFGSLLDDMSRLFRRQGRNDEAIDASLSAVEHGRRFLPENDPELADRLNNLALALRKAKKSEEAVSVCMEAMNIHGNTASLDKKTHATVLNTYFILLMEEQKYEDASKTIEKSLELSRISDEEFLPNYPNLLANYATVCMKLDRMDKAIDAMLKSLVLCENKDIPDNPDCARIAINLANVYQKSGLFEPAIENYYNALSILEKQDYMGADLGTILGGLSACYRRLGRYDLALSYSHKGIKYASETNGSETMEYSRRLNNLAELYLDIGMYDRAMNLITESINILENLDNSRLSYARTLGLLGAIHRRKSEFNEALEVQLKAQKIFKNVSGESSRSSIRATNNVALVWLDLDSLEYAIQMFRELVDDAMKTDRNEDATVASFLNHLATAYARAGNLDSAATYFEKTVALTHQTFGPDHPDYAPRLISWASVLAKQGEIAAAHLKYVDALDGTFKTIDQVFSFLAEQEREDFLKRIGDRFNELLCFFYANQDIIPDATELAYNIELRTKGMLLASVSRVRTAVRNSGSVELLTMYNEWLTKNTVLHRQYQLPINQRRKDLDEFQDEVNRIEGDISRRTSDLGLDFDSSISEWTDVRENLPRKSYAIEFTYRKPQNAEFGTYGALIIHKKSSKPLYISLCSELELNELLSRQSVAHKSGIDYLYRGATSVRFDHADNTGKLFRLIWEPLISIIPDKSTVFYAPTGALHKLSFAAFRDEKGAYLSDMYELNQVSSTALLKGVKNRSDLSMRSLLLMGGMAYGPSSGAITWDSLPGTLKEVKEIAKLARSGNNRVTLETGAKADEQFFLQHAPQHGIIHLATHGFYIEQNEQDKLLTNTTEADDYQDALTETPPTSLSGFINPHPLHRSGLVMANANHRRDTICETCSDNILTAAEIANMELHNTNLVVLSACETGLGDIMGNEGVYGLQRGFKMAGVESLLFSLWKVPDKETAEFMALMYSELANGKSLRQSFGSAQKQMRRKYTPYYWAAFVLVD